MHAQRGLIAAARRDQLANDAAMATRQHEVQRRARLAEDCETAEASLMHALQRPDTSSQHIQHSINVASKTGLVAPRLLQDAQHRLWRSTKRDMVRATRQPQRTLIAHAPALARPRSSVVEKPRPRMRLSPSSRRPPGHAPPRAPPGGSYLYL
tara:strand:- start:690 stop:1148 length:459 start_codon:yes stop_codon:yes gene_type:complete